MEAIILVHKTSAYSHLNGQTFTAVSINSSGLVLDVNGIDTFFTFKEVLIVDLQAVVRRSSKQFYKNGDMTYFRLKSYIEKRGFRTPNDKETNQ